MIQRKILQMVLEHLFSKSKRFKKIYDYVHKPNNLDMDVISLQAQVKDLKRKQPSFDQEDLNVIIKRLTKIEKTLAKKK